MSTQPNGKFSAAYDHYVNVIEHVSYPADYDGPLPRAHLDGAIAAGKAVEVGAAKTEPKGDKPKDA